LFCDHPFAAAAFGAASVLVVEEEGASAGVDDADSFEARL